MAPSRLLRQSAWVTEVEVQRDRRMLLTAAHHALDAWFRELEADPLREIDDLPSLRWLRRPDKMALEARVEGTVYERAPVTFAETVTLFANSIHEAQRRRPT